MTHPTPPPPSPTHEPSLQTVEMLCDRLGGLGLPVGIDTAREILRAVLAIEAPRMEIRVREALQTSLETVRVAAQSALGVLTSTTPVQTRAPAPAPNKPVLDPLPRRATQAPTPRPAPTRRPVAKRDSGDEDELGEARPVIRRPRGR
ncbi:MAG: hypothetical protein ABJC36_01580 [Gemmatimonadales bacterium]